MKTFHIKTFGCEMNYSDSERMVAFLLKRKIRPIDDIYNADLVIMNTCGVRQKAEDRVYGFIHNIKKKRPQTLIVMTGCIAHRKDVQRRMKNKVDLFTEIKDFPERMTDFLNNLNQKEFASCNNEYDEFFQITPQYKTRYSVSIPIMTGCNNFCSYCVVPYARGREKSRAHEDVINEVKNLLKKGYKEITLLGQNVNSYKSPTDASYNFAKLLNKVNELPGKFWLRFLTSHPKDMSDELIETITKGTNICEYVHLPIQAGNDEILKRMNRKYTSRHYLNLIKKIRHAFDFYKPAVPYALTTDLIVGFPGETYEQFLDSVKIFEKVRYDMAFTARFSPRPETAAWKMEATVTHADKEKREEELVDVLRVTSREKNELLVGRIEEILVEKIKDGFMFGKNRTFKNVKIKSDDKNLNKYIGEFINVKITKANDWSLEGELK